MLKHHSGTVDLIKDMIVWRKADVRDSSLKPIAHSLSNTHIT